MNWYKKLTSFYNNNPVLVWIVGLLPISAVVIFFFKTIKNYIASKLNCFFLLEISINLFLLLVFLTILFIICVVYIINKKRLKQQDKIIYSNIVGVAEKCLHFDSWETWASHALSPGQIWDRNAFKEIENFRASIFSCIWPGALPELERALKTLSVIMKDTHDTFLDHAAMSQDGSWYGRKFYQIDEWNSELYDKLFKEYDKWVDSCDSLIFEATKAVNWVAEIIRRDLNPDFFIEKGRFFIITGPHADLTYQRRILEYTAKEKKGMPYKRLKKSRK